MNYLYDQIATLYHQAEKDGRAKIQHSRTQFITVIRRKDYQAIQLTSTDGGPDSSLLKWIREESGWTFTKEEPIHTFGILLVGIPPAYPAPTKKPRKGAKKCA